MTAQLTTLVPFHLAIPVDDIDAARNFYGGVLGFSEGRSDTKWIDWNFRGHQVVTHQVGDGPSTTPRDGSPGPTRSTATTSRYPTSAWFYRSTSSRSSPTSSPPSARSS